MNTKKDHLLVGGLLILTCYYLSVLQQSLAGKVFGNLDGVCGSALP